MTHVAIHSIGIVGERRLAGLFGLLASALVLAQTADRLDPSMTIDELQKQEIFDTAGDWRKAEAEEEAAWREPEPAVTQRSRIEYGYDSLYDEARQRREQPATTLDLEIEKYKPNSAFRVKF